MNNTTKFNKVGLTRLHWDTEHAQYFNNISHALQKMPDVEFISSYTEPYLIEIEYNYEPLQLIYDILTGKLILGFSRNLVKLVNLTYDMLNEKGIRYYLNELLELKNKEWENQRKEVKKLLEEHVTNLYEYNSNTYMTFNYKNSDDIDFIFDRSLLRWEMRYNSFSTYSSNIKTESFRKKGIAYYLDELIKYR